MRSEDALARPDLSIRPPPRIAGSGDPAATKAFFSLATMTLLPSNFMLALMAAAVAFAPVARSFRYASAFTATVFALGGAAVARRGALSPDGALQFATYSLELLWTLAALTWRSGFAANVCRR